MPWMTGGPVTKTDRLARVAQDDRKRVAQAALLWGGVALSGTTLVAALTVWHLVRRGRVLRASLAPPRPIAPLDPRPVDSP